MDPISIILTALITGAAAALKPVTEQIVKDAYAGFKGLIQRKYGSVNVTMLESNPTSEARQAVVKEDLGKTDAGRDEELLREAYTLIDVIKTHASDVPKAMGIDIENFKATSLTAKDIQVKGNATALRGKGVDISGPVQLENFQVQSEGDTPPKKAENR